MKKERPTDFDNLNFKDLLVLRIIHESVALNGCPPTIREILNELRSVKKNMRKELKIVIHSKSNNVIINSLKKLEKAEYLTINPNNSRAITLLKESILPPILRYEGNITDSDLHYLQP